MSTLQRLGAKGEYRYQVLFKKKIVVVVFVFVFDMFCLRVADFLSFFLILKIKFIIYFF